MIGQSDLATYGDRVLAGTPVEVTVPDMGNNDTHVYIQGTDYVADLGDLSDLQVSADNPVLTVASKRLRKLKTGDETAENVTSNVADMGIGYCPSLEEIDSRNLTSLTGTVDLTQCPRLRKALFEGTNVANLQIPAGSKIEELSLPDTVTTLSLIRLPNLTEDNLKYNSLNALSYLRLENNDNINNFEMLKNAYTNSPALKNIRVVGFEYNADANDIAMIARFASDKDENGNPVYQGIGDNGDPTLGLPVLDGTFTLDGYLYESDYNIVKSNYPKLNIEAAGFYMDFEDPEVVRILLANMTTDDGIGITVEQAEAVTNIRDWFGGNTTIETFNEFERFIGVTRLLSDNLSTNNGLGFMGCTNLREITLPPTLKILERGHSVNYGGAGAFLRCSSLIAVKNSQLTTIGAYSFCNCTSLAMIDLSSVVSLNECAFYNCTALEFDELRTPNLTTIGSNAFYGVKIKKWLDMGKITSLSVAGFDKTALEELVVPETVTTVSANALSGYTALTSLFIDWSKITSIGASAFSSCTSLPTYEELNLPNLTSLGQNAFYGVKIKKLNLGALTTLPAATTSTQNFGDKTTLEEIVLKDGITTIPQYSFNGYTALKKCAVPTSVTSVAQQAFDNCKALLDFDFGNITSIGRYVFRNCTSLGKEGELSIPKLTGTIGSQSFMATKYTKIVNLGSATSIEDGLANWVGTFAKMPNLTEVRLPATITNIGSLAFYYDKALVSVICEAVTPPTLYSNAFFDCNNTFVIYVPDESVEAYKTASNWSAYASRIFPMSVYENGGVENVITFADPAVEAIVLANFDNGDGYFMKSEAAAVTSIGTVFKGNTEITSFDEFENFTGVTSIAVNAFTGCTSLSKIGAPSSLATISAWAFQNCSALTTVSFPTISGTVGVGAFQGSGVVRVENLGSVSVLSSNANWELGVFRNCKSLQYVDLPATITKIDSGTFIDCSRLATLIVRATTPPTLGGVSFNNTAIEGGTGSIYVPDSAVDTYKIASGWVTYASRIKPLSEYTE